MAGERHGHGMLCVNRPLKVPEYHTQFSRRYLEQYFADLSYCCLLVNELNVVVTNMAHVNTRWWYFSFWCIIFSLLMAVYCQVWYEKIIPFLVILQEQWNTFCRLVLLFGTDFEKQWFRCEFWITFREIKWNLGAPVFRSHLSLTFCECEQVLNLFACSGVAKNSSDLLIYLPPGSWLRDPAKF